MIETRTPIRLNKVDLAIGKYCRITKARGGEDTGTPVIHEYDAKMPFKFTGTLEKVRSSSVPMNSRPNNAANSNS